MSLQLLTGPSGSGKTTYLYGELIRKAQQNAAFQAMAVVPEQFTMQTQKDLVTLHENHSVTNIDILSFDRLAYRIMGELGIEGLTVLDDMGKLMILRRAAALCGKKLTVFGKNLDKAGFIDKIKSMLSELYQYRIGVEELDRLIAETEDEPLLRRKLTEIRTLYVAFDESMKEDTIPSERLYDVLCRLIPRSQLIRESEVSFDGFTGFTPAQYQVLEALMQHAKRVIVTVTVDEELAKTEGGPASLRCPKEREDGEKTGGKRQRALLASNRQLFEMSLTTAHTLRRLAEKNGVRVETDHGFEPGARFGACPALAALERQFLRCPVSPCAGIPEGICLWEVKDRQAEVEAVAREIFDLVRRGSFRYRDIAVVSSDIAGYEPVLREVFGRCHIPFFLDIKNNMMGHPLVAYLRGALETVEKDFSYETVFACLKSGMAPIGENDLFELENYVLATGIRGKRAWNTVWERVYREARHLDLDRLNQIRAQVAEPLSALGEALKAADGTVRDYAAAMVELMQSQGIEKRLKEMAAQIAADGDISLSMEYEQAYDKVLELLDKVVELFGDGHVPVREWREILDTGFSEIRVGVIPAYVDRVVAGDMHRTRLKDPRALFFLGANDGLVPAAGDKASLLSDIDRRSLARRGVHLAPTKQENGFMDRFYLYLTLTKPSERLYVSWCRQSAGGAAMAPSYMIGELQGVFPGAKIRHPDEGVPLAEQIVSMETARTALLSGFAAYREGKAPESWKELYGLFLRLPKERERLMRWLDAAFLSYHEESMGPAVARALYGELLDGSVTRLEQYAACAYAQFLSYGLRLVERQLHEFAAADMGTLFHEVIRRFFARVYAEQAAGDYDAVLYDGELRRQLVHECLEEAAAQGHGLGLEDTARGAYLLGRVERTAERTLWALCEQLARGDFRPSEVEVEFDGRNSRAMNLTLDEDTLMRLHGRIDRVDTCEGGEEQEEIYVKVIDYKTGNTSFDLTAVYYGLQLQLVVYLEAAMERERRRHKERTVIPAGILYYNIRDPFVTVDAGQASNPDPDQMKDALLKELKMNGIVNRDRRIYSRMDRLAGGQAPPVIPVVEKDGQLVEKRSSVADTKRLHALCGFVKGRMKEFGSRIMAGDVAVNPYMKDGKTGCDYCRFAAVCGFDRKTPGYGYRRLEELNTGEIWERMDSSGENG
ncbi:MAG: ATP-dependent helicase [Lachnospiraceae bacterium]|nr:ATP-dependent helicase [Lachnospiraceae bacterium]